MYSITIQQKMDDRLGMYLIPLSVQRLMTWLILINRDSPIMDTHVVIICIWCGYNGFIEIDILASCTVDNREEYMFSELLVHV